MNTVWGLQSPEAGNLLQRHRLNLYQLETAMARYQSPEGEGRYIGTIIGLMKDGLLASRKDNWSPDQLDAFSEPLIAIPWCQLHELIAETQGQARARAT